MLLNSRGSTLSLKTSPFQIASNSIKMEFAFLAESLNWRRSKATTWMQVLFPVQCHRFSGSVLWMQWGLRNTFEMPKQRVHSVIKNTILAKKQKRSLWFLRLFLYFLNVKASELIPLSQCFTIMRFFVLGNQHYKLYMNANRKCILRRSHDNNRLLLAETLQHK